jgi:hypothetical protein
MLCSICVSSAHAGWFGYDNYDDCMLGRMKGQDKSLYRNADKACKRQFKIKTPISPSLVKWQTETQGDFLYIDIYNWPDEFEKISGKFIFSKKPCSEAKDTDFGLPEIVEFNDIGHGVANVDPWDGVCVRIITFTGLEK